MKRLLILLIFLNGFNIHSYSKPLVFGVLSGKIIDAGNGEPIVEANIALVDVSSKQVIAQTKSDSKGFFRFSDLKPNSYLLRVGFVGYTMLQINEINLTEKSPNKDLGILKLISDQTSVDEVIITSTKPQVQFGADGITYNVDQSLLAEGSTATDILKNVPLVDVDVDGNTTIAGKRNTKVFIDGKPSEYMSSNITELLNVLPSDAIEKIEVLTNPPAKYAGDGDGVINIILKKGYKVGFNGSIGVTAGAQGNLNSNLNTSYKSSLWSLNASGSYREGIWKSTNESYRKNFFPDTAFYYNQFTNTRNLSNGNNFKVGFDWDISPSQNIRISTNLNTNNSNNKSNTAFHYLSKDYIESRVRNQANNSDGSNHNTTLNVEYKIKTDSVGGKLTIGTILNRSNNKDDRYYDRATVFPTNQNPTLQNNYSYVTNNAVNINIDYDKPMAKKRDLLELGIQYNNRKNNNDLLVHNFNFTSQNFQINKDLTNQFTYSEHLYSVYVSYSYKKNGWSVKPGVRTEITDVKFDLSSEAQFNLKPYASLFPSISLNKFFKNKYNFGASFSIRINRPGLNALNPQVNNQDPLNISFGNPNLEPAYTKQIEFSFGAFGSKWAFTPRLSYAFSDGVIERFRTVYESGIAETTFKNVGKNQSLSIYLLGNYKPTKKINTHANFSITQSNYKSSLNQSLNRNGINIRSSSGLSFQLPAKIAVEGNFNYSNTISAQGRNKGAVSTGFAIRKQFLDNKLTFRINTTNPFGNGRNSNYNEGNNFFLQSYSINNNSNANFSLNYRFTTIQKKPAIPPPTNK